jgi:ESCRT-I complex subunit TSG101
LLNRPPPPLPVHPPQITTSPPTYISRSSGYQHMVSDGNVLQPSALPRDTMSPDHNYRWSVSPAGPAISGQLDQSHASNTPSPPVPLQHSQGPPPPLPSSWPQPNVSLHPFIATPNLLDEETADSLPPAQQFSTAAPPRPPNPELLRLHSQVHDRIGSELASLSQVILLDAERLRAQQTDLLAGEPAIRDEMARLEAVRDVCNNVSGRLRNTVEQAERNITELRRKGDPEVDELICSTSIVHNQYDTSPVFFAILSGITDRCEFKPFQTG